MTILQILVFSLAALFIGRLIPVRWRGPALMIASLLAIFWLQPTTPIRNLDFWFPTASVGLTILVWAITSPRQALAWRNAGLAAVVVLTIILGVSLGRYFGPLCCLTPTRPPGLLPVGLVLALLAGGILLILRLKPASKLPATLATLLILVLFVILKSEPLGQAASAGLRLASGQTASLATPLDLRWLGFSYLAFRLLHALRDYVAGKLPAYRLDEFITYALFFPAYTAGPIDRSQRFMGDLRSLCSPADTRWKSDFSEGGWRILIGMFKKFVLADSLATFALNPISASLVSSTLWTWVMLYAYALRLYFDFSGYTDVALGLARLLGINLPENFSAPYLKTNLTAFWNSWHITLAQWFRAYFFNPFTRALRSGKLRLPVWVVILAGQVITFLLIGLWHGIALNFVLWGLWHGFGMFVHNRWSDWARPRLGSLEGKPQVRRTLALGGWFLTFHYVTLGWVWFTIPDISLGLDVFRRLLGN